ncbi:AraC family transcriptional regulator [Desulfovibrio sp. OttesenSCG-928-M14]|nr:AraC family transcriptional regulator [Desulfovibrio sp. OttesenSCG-928-M14]
MLRGYIAQSRVMLRDTLLELLPKEGSYSTRIPGFTLHRFDHPAPPRRITYTPMLVVVVQGKKWVKIGVEEFVYGDRTCFVAGVATPVLCCVQEASPEKPYLALTIDLDSILFSRFLMRNLPCSAFGPKLGPESGRLFLSGAQVQNINDELLDACLRLLRLQATPAQIPFLAPLFRQEIHYRLLFRGEQSNPVHVG